jgi:hypothetical protein
MSRGDKEGLRKTFGPGKEEVTADWEKLNIVKLCDLYMLLGYQMVLRSS